MKKTQSRKGRTAPTRDRTTPQREKTAAKKNGRPSTMRRAGDGPRRRGVGAVAKRVHSAPSELVVMAEPALPDLTDRMTVRTRPEGPPILLQTWDKLLFLHWQVPVDALRALIPPPLGIDTHNGTAWVAITPFTITENRTPFMPPLPWATSFHEVNVRTYVHYDGVPGVWFFSLDANSALAVAGARAFFRLPYFNADIVHEVEGKRVHCRSTRKDPGPPAAFSATWTPAAVQRHAEPGSLEFFWTERYCLYTVHRKTLYRGRIYHEPWPIRDVMVANHESNLIESQGLPIPGRKDKVRLLDAGPVHAEIWPLEEVATVGKASRIVR